MLNIGYKKCKNILIRIECKKNGVYLWNTLLIK